MPELPEVESLRLYLISQGLVRRTIIDFSVDMLGTNSPLRSAVNSRSNILGRDVVDINRIGKNLIILLDAGAIIMHMGMTGRLAIRLPHQSILKYTRAIFYLDDRRRLELDDQRRWASIRFVKSSENTLRKLGPDVLSDIFTVEVFKNLVMKRRASIKSLIVNQQLMSGVGNIYADEALHKARIHPKTPANHITKNGLTDLYVSLQETLKLGICFVKNNPDKSGLPFVVNAYDDRMRLQRKKGSTCPDCLNVLKTNKINGRTSFFCFTCQI